MGRHYYRRGGVNKGLEAAKRHIEEAHVLSQELGGTDKDVKQWFFNLPNSERDKVFIKYTNEHGHEAGDYARTTFNDWKTGKRQMSGMVAARLFKLLPPIMPLATKYQLVDSLWNHVAPTKKRLIKAGITTPVNEIIDALTKEVRDLSVNWEIPESMKKRFEWLAQQDSQTYQQLLQHIKEVEKYQGEKILKEQVPILKHKFESDLLETASRLSYIVQVGKQSVELRLTKDIKMITASDWVPDVVTPSPTPKTGIPVFVWIIGFIVLMLFFMSKK